PWLRRDAAAINISLPRRGVLVMPVTAGCNPPHGLGTGSNMLPLRLTTLSVSALVLSVLASGPARGQTFVPGFDSTDPQAAFTPRDRRLQGHFEQIQNELADPQADHRATLESLQQLIDQADDVFTDAAMDQSIRDRAQQLIATLPEPNARLYEETFGAAAQALLDADEPDRQQARRQVVRRFFYTTAGADAAWK